MATKDETNRRTEPVEASDISQESDLIEKPTKEALAKSGYRLPESHYALEEAGGDLERANEIMRQNPDTPLYQDQVNARADRTQAEHMERMGREYRVPGRGVVGAKDAEKASREADEDAGVEPQQSRAASAGSEGKRAAEPSENKGGGRSTKK